MENANTQRRFAYADPKLTHVQAVLEARGANAAADKVAEHADAGRSLGMQRAKEAAPPELLTAAQTTAMRIARTEGFVTCPALVVALRADGWGDLLDALDLRALGHVFRRPHWHADGVLRGKQSPGSHRRPVTVWRLRGEP